MLLSLWLLSGPCLFLCVLHAYVAAVSAYVLFVCIVPPCDVFAACVCVVCGCCAHRCSFLWVCVCCWGSCVSLCVIAMCSCVVCSYGFVYAYVVLYVMYGSGFCYSCLCFVFLRVFVDVSDGVLSCAVGFGLVVCVCLFCFLCLNVCLRLFGCVGVLCAFWLCMCCCR